MLNIRVLEVENLPVYTKKPRKTSISCYSSSSYHYFYGSFNSKDKSKNPKWNASFNIDLFRLIDLKFDLYATKSCSKDIFLGSVNIDLIQFFSKYPGNQIIGNAGVNIRSEFPITSTHSANSYLSLSFSYSPKIYRHIQFKPTLLYKKLIHVYASFQPFIEFYKTPVEIELLQAIPVFESLKRTPRYGIYYNLNKDTPWETTGDSSSDRYFMSPSGRSQIHSLSLSKMDGHFTFFILNVADYSGTVTLHFVYEKKGKFHHVDDVKYMKPKTAKAKIGTIQTVDIQVHPHRKILVPLFLFLRTNLFHVHHCESVTETAVNDGYSDQSENEFHSKIMKNVKNIKDASHIDFFRVNVLPTAKTVSLERVLSEFHIQQNMNLRFYVGGLTTYIEGNATCTDFWNQGFIVYDSKTGQRCSQLCNELTSKPISQTTVHPRVSHSYLLTKFRWNSILNVNLNSIGNDKVLVYYVSCNSELELANHPGFFLISSFLDQSETLLFRNQIFPEIKNAHFATCCRFEFVENDWKIVPMRHYFNDQKEMDFAIDSMKANGWVMPEILSARKNKMLDHETLSDEYLIRDDKFHDQLV